MRRPGFISTEKKSRESSLVVDKNGMIAESLIRRLCSETNIVYVGRKSKGLDIFSNIIHIPYGSQFPSIPQYRYSYVFVVDDGTKTTRKSLSKFSDKVERDCGKFIFVVQRENVLEKYASFVSDRRGSKVVVVGDIFGKGNNLIQKTLSGGVIRLEGDGLSETYPVFLEDAVSGILEVAFSSNDPFHVFYLFPKYPPTQISLAHMFQRINPEIKIDFVKQRKEKDQKIVLPSHGKYLLDDDYDIQNRIKSLLLELNRNENKDKPDERFLFHKDNFNPFPLVGALSLVLILLLPLILTFIFSFLGFGLLKSAKENLYKGDLIAAQRQVKFSQNLFLLAKKTSVPLLAEAKVVDRESKVESFVKNISIGQNTSLAGVYFVESLNKFEKVLNNESKNAKIDFTSASYLLREALVFLQKAQAEGLVEDFDLLIKFFSATEILPDIFGFDGEKNYLVLFQDNTELRPTGGIISSYGLFTIKNGVVKNFSTYDVYEADRRLKGHVEPPFPIRRHGAQKHWYLKDSNFDIDFVRSASKSAFFLDVEVGKKVDGVIAIDTYFIEQLVSSMPFFVTDYKKNIDKNNFYKIFSLTQGKDFLRTVFDSFLMSISSKKNLPYLDLAKIVSDSLVRKHILLAFANPNIQNFFTVNDYSSSLRLLDGTPFRDKRLGDETVIDDFVGINEANLGENKANRVLKRMVSNDVTIDDSGNVIANLVIQYDNKSDYGWFRGDYKNYLRVILNEEAQILSISIDGKDQKIVDAVTDPDVYESDNFVAPRGLEVEEIEEFGKSFFGFLIKLPAGKSQTIGIKYSLAQIGNLDMPSFSYNLDYFKQPGTEDYPFKLSIKYPSAFAPVGIRKEFEDKDGKISLSKNINSDKNIQVRFAKK